MGNYGINGDRVIEISNELERLGCLDEVDMEENEVSYSYLASIAFKYGLIAMLESPVSTMHQVMTELLQLPLCSAKWSRNGIVQWAQTEESRDPDRPFDLDFVGTMGQLISGEFQRLTNMTNDLVMAVEIDRKLPLVSIKVQDAETEVRLLFRKSQRLSRPSITIFSQILRFDERLLHAYNSMMICLTHSDEELAVMREHKEILKDMPPRCPTERLN
jgi:hypothetical protein